MVEFTREELKIIQEKMQEAIREYRKRGYSDWEPPTQTCFNIIYKIELR